jgi:hypothetical protein
MSLLFHYHRNNGLCKKRTYVKQEEEIHFSVEHIFSKRTYVLKGQEMY